MLKGNGLNNIIIDSASHTFDARKKRKADSKDNKLKSQGSTVVVSSSQMAEQNVKVLQSTAVFESRQF